MQNTVKMPLFEMQLERHRHVEARARTDADIILRYELARPTREALLSDTTLQDVRISVNCKRDTALLVRLCLQNCCDVVPFRPVRLRRTIPRGGI